MPQPLERGAVPPSTAVEQPQIKQALAGWEEARAAAREADRTLVRLERGSGRVQADARDAQELADALQDGKTGPKAAKHIQEFERALSEAQRAARATAVVEERRWADTQAALAAHIDELRQHTDQEFERRRGAYVAAVDAVEQAHARMAELIAMRTFLAKDGWGAGAYHAAGWAATITAPAPNALDDSQVAVADVLSELRDVGGPPRPREGLNPDALRNEHGHLAPWQQGRVRQIGVPGQTAAPPVRIPG